MLAQEYSAPAGDPVFMPMDESNLEPADDMVTLGDLHEAALLHNVRLRFFNDDIFTYIGPILCAANPYKMIPIFTGEFVSVRRRHFRLRVQPEAPRLTLMRRGRDRNTSKHRLVQFCPLTCTALQTMLWWE